MKNAAPTLNRLDSQGDRRDKALAAARERLRVERDRAIRGAHRHGVPSASLVRMTKISPARIAEILNP
jgi:hypothetical protein